MVNTITHLFGIGSQWLFQNRKSSNEVAPPQYFEVPNHKVSVDRISSIRINKGCVQINRVQEPTLQISLKPDGSDTQLNTTHELVFAGDQANYALDALANCGYLDDIDIRVKKRVFLNARFDYQDDLSNYRVVNSFTQQTSGVH